MAHTLRPWKVDEFGGIYMVDPEDDGVFPYIHYIATVHSADNKEADARLIAAAPELLEACEWLVYLMHNIGKNGGPPSDMEYEEAGDFAKTAIAKAAGKE